MPKVQSPCIGVCKFKRPGPAGAHCIGCSMTKDQKAVSKRLKKGKEVEGFVVLVQAQQDQMGRYAHWRDAYMKKALKKGRRVPGAVRRAS